MVESRTYARRRLWDRSRRDKQTPVAGVIDRRAATTMTTVAVPRFGDVNQDVAAVLKSINKLYDISEEDLFFKCTLIDR